MIDRVALLADLQKLLARLEADLLQRSESTEVPAIGQHLRAEFERAKTAERTALNYEDWRSDATTQCAAAWVLSCVFVRFLEDNRLIDPPKIAGPGPQLQQARDEHELYFRQHPRETDRDYLLAIFTDLGKLPGTKDVFGQQNPLNELPNWLSGDAAGELLRFFQKVDANTGSLVHDFTDPQWDTRFLGDLYQDLSDAARKKYALLQTPEFVEEFILDRTLEPALDEFGLEQELAPDEQKSLPGMDDKVRLKGRFRMIDPACGSGHFLLGAFPRILGRWQRKEPGTKARELVQRTLDSIHGVDVNPYAVAIARFRLLLAALRACGTERLDKGVPGFQLNLVCGDSLMHGSPGGDQKLLSYHELAHVYQSEDLAELRRILAPGRYHAVVANPPYITVKDKALNQAYRDRYPDVCHMKYSLSVPFLQRLVDLTYPNGFTGQITANSFMKREFGKKLIESYLPKIDLTHVVDTSGAYIPGHGTPTVVLFARNRKPVSSVVRSVMGIKGEQSKPADPAQGHVWSAITQQIDHPGQQSAYVSTNDTPRGQFEKHPWSIGGGGAAELKDELDAFCTTTLDVAADSIGITCFTLADDFYFVRPLEAQRRGIGKASVRGVVIGDEIRDWLAVNSESLLFPYDERFLPLTIEDNELFRFFWIGRTVLSNNKMFGGKTKVECGLQWYEFGRLTYRKLLTPFSITFANVATHTHFVLDRGSRVFECHAPVIKLPAISSEDEHLGILGLLNSSVACFWLKQVCHSKGSQGVNEGIKTEAWEHFREFSATALGPFPLPAVRPVALASQLDSLARQLTGLHPAAVVREAVPTASLLAERRRTFEETRARMIALQEELDWECCRLYGLVNATPRTDDPPPLQLGQRAFEFVLARKLAAGEEETTWFARHGSTPITEMPCDWPESYRELVQQRIDLIESNSNIGLIERPEYKRRWNTEPWEEQQERALVAWLLDRLESYFDLDGRMNEANLRTARIELSVVSIAQLADLARQDAEFQQVGALYRDDLAFDVQSLVSELVAGESVPLLPVLRYKESGLRKRAEWEQTWALQRREDAGEQVGVIPVPPKYTSADFVSTGGIRYWALRGKLDVPKERWISFPHSPAADGTLTIVWAGYDHLQQARAISAYYVDIQERLGGRDDERLPPLLACLLELLPWLKQWHNDPDPSFDGLRMGDYFESFITEQARTLPLKVQQEDGTTKTVTGWTIDQIKAWTPPTKSRARKTRAPKSTSTDAQ